MAEISQKLGFDVTQGVRAMADLKRSVDQLTFSLGQLNNVQLGGIAKQIDSFRKGKQAADNSTKSLQAFNKTMGTQVPQGITAANAQLNVLNRNFEVTKQKSQGAGDAVRSSFANAFVFGQALSGLSSVISLLGDASTASREFGQAIGEVSTVAGSGDTFAGLSDAVRDLSREFGRPEVEQAEATYQAFSNQVIQSTADMGFLADANRLAVASVSSTGDSVNVLSSVINSFGDEVGNATQISDVLFKTVEEGRLRIGEIANSLGTVTPLAKEAGVSFTEVTASLAAITKRGTTASVAMTQVRGIVSKILKPTKLMNEAFASFGAKDGPAAIKQAGGLSQLLLKMKQFADDNGTSLNKMFGRVRAGAGALNITANGAEDFNNILNELENSAGATQEAFDKINGTDARQAEIAFNKLKVTVSELGDSVVPVITAFGQMFGFIIPDATSLGILLAGITVALAALAATAASAFIGGAAIAAAFVAAAPAILALTAAIGGALIVQKLITKSVEETTQARELDGKVAARLADQGIENAEKNLKSIKKIGADTAKLLEKEFGKTLDSIRSSAKGLRDTFDSAFSNIRDITDDVITKLGKNIKDANDIIDEGADTAKDYSKTLRDLDFEKSLKGLDATAKAHKLLERAQTLGAKAVKAFDEAGTDRAKIAKAVDLEDEARDAFKASDRASSRSGNKVDDRLNEEAFRKFAQNRVRQGIELQVAGEKLAREESKNLAKVTKGYEDQSAQVQSLKGEIGDLLSTTGDNGLPKSTEQIAEDLILAKQKAAELFDVLSQDPSDGLREKLGLGDGSEERELAFEAILEFGKGQNALRMREDVQKVLDSATFSALVSFKEQAAEAQIAVDDAKLGKEVTSARNTLQAQLDAQALVVPFKASTEHRIGQGIATAVAFMRNLATETELVQGAIGGVVSKIQEISTISPEIGSAELAARSKALDALEEKVRSTDTLRPDDRVEALQRVDQAKAIFESAATLIEAKEAAIKGSEAALEVKTEESARSAGDLSQKTGEVSNKMGAAAGGANSLASATATAVSNTNNLVSATNNLVSAQSRLKSPSATTAFFGKAIHRQTGGFTRGQDRVLTSTAPGEFVVNAASSRRFRSELTAMNAGQSPQFRENGGTTTNTVGDINLNINGSDPSQLNGEGLVKDINRAIRTKRSRLFNS